MKEIIPNSQPQNIVEIKNFTPHKNKYYAASLHGTGGEVKGIIMSEGCVHSFNKPTKYVVLAMEDMCRRNAYYDYLGLQPTLTDYIQALLNKGAKIFEFDSFKEMAEWLVK